jgi:hypothetical protein
MTEADGKPGARPDSQSDPLSATGMFLDAFRWQPDQSQGEAAATDVSPVGQGEFTELFGTLNPAAPLPQSQSAAPAPRTTAAPQETLKPASGDVTRIFVQQPPQLTEQPARGVPSPAPSVPANPPRMKGYSSPGASDSASAEGSFTQLFRTVTPSPAPLPRVQPLATQASSLPPAVEKTEWPASTQKSPGATDLFRALSAAEGSQADRHAPRSESFSNTMPASPAPGSVTGWIQKLSEVQPSPMEQAFEPPPLTAMPASGTVSGQGEYTRIISGGVPAPPVPAIPRTQAPAIEPPKVAAPKLTPPALAVPAVPAPAVPAPRTKLQEMLPILLVLNAFLLVVLILVVVFALMRK